MTFVPFVGSSFVRFLLGVPGAVIDFLWGGSVWLPFLPNLPWPYCFHVGAFLSLAWGDVVVRSLVGVPSVVLCLAWEVAWAVQEV